MYSFQFFQVASSSSTKYALIPDDNDNSSIPPLPATATATVTATYRNLDIASTNNHNNIDDEATTTTNNEVLEKQTFFADFVSIYIFSL